MYIKKIKPLTGTRIGRLLVVKPLKTPAGKSIRWLCKCECGNETIVGSSCLREKNTYTIKSCGCLRNEKAKLNGTNYKGTHGKKGTRVYRIWCKMKYRCLNKNSTAYKNYGGRGIKIHTPWLDFKNFYKDMGEPPTDKHTLDRIDNDGNYCKENCRWATRKEQSNNMRSNLLIKYEDRLYTAQLLSEKLNIPRSSLVYKVKHNQIKGEIINNNN